MEIQKLDLFWWSLLKNDLNNDIVKNYETFLSSVSATKVQWVKVSSLLRIWNYIFLKIIFHAKQLNYGKNEENKN